jgi:hypothetical protein
MANSRMRHKEKEPRGQQFHRVEETEMGVQGPKQLYFVRQIIREEGATQRKHTTSLQRGSPYVFG